jgi:hypothetical protein
MTEESKTDYARDCTRHKAREEVHIQSTVTSSSVATFTCFHDLNDAGAAFVLTDTDALRTLWAERLVLRSLEEHCPCC